MIFFAARPKNFYNFDQILIRAHFTLLAHYFREKRRARQDFLCQINIQMFNCIQEMIQNIAIIFVTKQNNVMCVEFEH